MMILLIKLLFVFTLWRGSASDYELARIIAGETPGCPVAAKLAVANVHERNSVWYGNSDPGLIDLWIATHWRAYPDPSFGAQYMIHPKDRVKMPWLKYQTNEWRCNGTEVQTWN